MRFMAFGIVPAPTNRETTMTNVIDDTGEADFERAMKSGAAFLAWCAVHDVTREVIGKMTVAGRGNRGPAWSRRLASDYVTTLESGEVVAWGAEHEEGRGLFVFDKKMTVVGSILIRTWREETPARELPARELNKIPLTAENETELQAALDLAKGTSRSTAWPTASMVIGYAERAEERLSDVPKKHRVGSTVEYRGEGPSSNKYRYRKAVPAFQLVRKTAGWHVQSAGIEEVFPKAAEVFLVGISAAAADSVVQAALKPFVIVEPEPRHAAA